MYIVYILNTFTHVYTCIYVYIQNTWHVVVHVHVHIPYDVDGDLITIAESSDLNLAKQLSRVLKITIFSESIYMYIVHIYMYMYMYM